MGKVSGRMASKKMRALDAPPYIVAGIHEQTEALQALVTGRCLNKQF